MGQREQRFLKEIKEEENKFLQTITPKEKEEEINSEMEKYIEALDKINEEWAIKRFKEINYIPDDFDMDGFRQEYKKIHGIDILDEAFNLEFCKKQRRAKLLNKETKKTEETKEKEKEIDPLFGCFIISFVILIVIVLIIFAGCGVF